MQGAREHLIPGCSLLSKLSALSGCFDPSWPSSQDHNVPSSPELHFTSQSSSPDWGTERQLADFNLCELKWVYVWRTLPVLFWFIRKLEECKSSDEPSLHIDCIETNRITGLTGTEDPGVRLKCLDLRWNCSVERVLLKPGECAIKRQLLSPSITARRASADWRPGRRRSRLQRGTWGLITDRVSRGGPQFFSWRRASLWPSLKTEARLITHIAASVLPTNM